MQISISFTRFVAQSDLPLLTFSAIACSYLNVIWMDRKGYLHIS